MKKGFHETTLMIEKWQASKSEIEIKQLRRFFGDKSITLQNIYAHKKYLQKLGIPWKVIKKLKYEPRTIISTEKNG